MSRLLLSPLARKRWQQFRRSRRASLSLLLLLLIYLVSLAAELWCNDQPLYLRFEGRSYFPFLRYLSQERLFGNGLAAAPDYELLRHDPRFAAGSGNRIVMAPIPHGPHKVERPELLQAYRRVSLTVVPAVALGRLNLTASGLVTRPLGCDAFLAPGVRFDETPLTNHWQMTPALAAALEQRFAGGEAAAFKAVLQPLPESRALPVEVSLLATRGRATASVRLALREPDTTALAPFTLRLAQRDGGLVPLKSEPWRKVPPELRDELLRWAGEVVAERSGAATGRTLVWQGREASVTLRREAISWPHRPVPGHWLGIDAAGRDVLARLLYGTRIALSFGLLLVLWAMLLGLTIGALQGYFGGLTDLATQRFIEIWSALPFLYVMILLGAVVGRSFALLLFCYGLFNWIGLSYYMRAEFLRLRRRAFVEAARCQGLSPLRIIWRHILPNALTPLITLMPFSLVGAIGAITALDFLGFGLPPLTPSWGELLQQAQQNRTAWWLILYPSLTLFSVMLLTVFIGEGLREAFDPKSDARYR